MKRTGLERVLAGSLLAMLAIFVQLAFSLWEGSRGLVAGTATSSIKVSVDVVPSISIDSPADVVLSPNIQETGTATGSATWNVKTNNVAGWKLEVNASTVPAMKSGSDSFADYAEAVPGTPKAWSVPSADSSFGFSANGTYADAAFSGNKYLGFDGTNRIEAAHRSSQADGSGDNTTIDFQAEVGSGHNQPDGTYAATVTATATAL